MRFSLFLFSEPEGRTSIHFMCPIRPINPDGSWGQKQRREYLLDENGRRIEVVDTNDEIYPWIAQNDIVVVSGTELYSGKTIDD